MCVRRNKSLKEQKESLKQITNGDTRSVESMGGVRRSPELMASTAHVPHPEGMMGAGRASHLFPSLRPDCACWTPDLESHHPQRAGMQLAENCRANKRVGVTHPPTTRHWDRRHQHTVWITLTIQELKHPKVMDILVYLILLSTRT